MFGPLAPRPMFGPLAPRPVFSPLARRPVFGPLARRSVFGPLSPRVRAGRGTGRGAVPIRARSAPVHEGRWIDLDVRPDSRIRVGVSPCGLDVY